MTTKTSTPNLQIGPSYEDSNSPTGWSADWYDLNVERNEWEAAWAAYWGEQAPAPLADETRKQGGKAHEIDPETKRQFSEAVAYIREYRGNWGFILDLRADPKWNTKWFRLSDRQVEVILNAKKRDAERVVAPSSHPRYAEAVEFATANAAGNDFLTSIADQAKRRTLSDKQVEAVLRNADRTPKAGTAPVEIGEGWYMVDKTPFKVQHNLQHTNLYAKRLTPEGWEFVRGGLRLIAEKGQPMTREAAAEYGRLYGVCGVCGRELTDETSIEAGIGPVCSGRLA